MDTGEEKVLQARSIELNGKQVVVRRSVGGDTHTICIQVTVLWAGVDMHHLGVKLGAKKLYILLHG